MFSGRTSASTILTYHDFVSARDSKSLWFDCTPYEFRHQILWLRSHGAHFVTLEKIVNHYATGSHLPAHAISLTFADGYAGFYRYAVPILRREKIPATMFVHTAFVGNQQGRPKMTWPQLKELDKSGLIRIESETVTHPADLRVLSMGAVQREMRDSRATLELHLGRLVRFVAYPNGKYNLQSEQAARFAGYQAGFSEVTRPVEKSKNIWSINRYVHTKWKEAWEADKRY